MMCTRITVNCNVHWWYRGSIECTVYKTYKVYNDYDYSN